MTRIREEEEVLCTITVVHTVRAVLTDLDCALILLRLALSSECLCIFGLHGAIYLNFLLHYLLCILVN